MAEEPGLSAHVPAVSDGGDRAWMTRPERGTVLGIKALLLFCRVFGRRGAGVILAIITF